MSEGIMPASWDQTSQRSMLGGSWALGGRGAHDPRQRYDRDARYAAIPARRSSAL